MIGLKPTACSTEGCAGVHIITCLNVSVSILSNPRRSCFFLTHRLSEAQEREERMCCYESYRTLVENEAAGCKLSITFNTLSTNIQPFIIFQFLFECNICK